MNDHSATPFATRHRRLIGTLFRKSGGEAWGLSEQAFAKALERSATSAGPDVAGHLESLHVEDLALAAACMEGLAPAWERFVAVYQHDLRNAGRAIAGGSEGVELADSIYGELYGIDTRDGERRSLFVYFHGRSRLSTWLRAILAQRHVDRVRANRRFEPLDETGPAAERAPHGPPAGPPDPARRHLVSLFGRALAESVRTLDESQRLRLAWYYTHRLTLAQIGRTLGEHEATVSRKLDRAKRDVRVSVEQILTERFRLSAAEIELCYEYGIEDGRVDLEALFGAVPRPADPSVPPGGAGSDGRPETVRSSPTQARVDRTF